MPDRAPVLPLTSLAATLCALVRGDAEPGLWRAWTPGDWERLVAGAASHGVAGLVRRTIVGRGWERELPPAAWRALRERAYADAGHNLRAYKTLAEVLALAPPATSLVVLKGAALGPSLYPAPALRPLTDVDLLAPPAVVDALRVALEARGYRRQPAMAPELASALDPHVALVGGPAGAVAVELHWGLVAGHADWRAAPLTWFWEQTEPWAPPPAIAGAVGARQLSPTAALLYQAAHLVLQHGHDPARLIWLYDLHLLAGHPRLDWPELCAQAHALGWGPALRAALEQAERCFGTILPSAHMARLAGALDSRASFHGPDASPARPYDSWAALAQLTPIARLRLLARLALPSRAYLRAQYAPRWGPWWPLAYLYRWLKPLWRRRS